MFCPECGKEENQSVPFCRACGTDLKRVRVAVGSSESISQSAASARSEIGRAVAEKIRETRGTSELKKVAENVLPEIEKFLESPEEKRLRRMRTGMTLSSVGIGVAISLSIVALITAKEEFLFMAGLGSVAFFIGLGFILNGVFLSVPRGRQTGGSVGVDIQRELNAMRGDTNELDLPEPVNLFSSVTEPTTRHLKKEPRQGRD